MRMLLLIALVLSLSACGDTNSQGTVTGGNDPGLQGVQWSDGSITVERHLPSVKKGDVVCFNREVKTITKGACP